MDYKINAFRKALPLKWRNLYYSERAALTNGCGGKGGWFDPPDYCFKASCDQHDFNYWLGGDESDRQKADRQFLAAMLEDVRACPWWARPHCYLAAWRYYLAVRWFGASYFNFRQTPPTWEDVEQVLSAS
jgi:phospholipase A2-like protein